MKKLKLNLDEIKVESFETTDASSLSKGTIMGQVTWTQFLSCHTDDNTCGRTCDNDTIFYTCLGATCGHNEETCCPICHTEP
jgi:hypothetical protein